jgi:hypothetical protein
MWPGPRSAQSIVSTPGSAAPAVPRHSVTEPLLSGAPASVPDVQQEAFGAAEKEHSDWTVMARMTGSLAGRPDGCRGVYIRDGLGSAGAAGR